MYLFIFIETRDKKYELKALKAQLLELKHKISAELAPKRDEKDGEEVKPNPQQQQQPGRVIETTTSSQSQSTEYHYSVPLFMCGCLVDFGQLFLDF